MDIRSGNELGLNRFEPGSAMIPDRSQDLLGSCKETDDALTSDDFSGLKERRHELPNQHSGHSACGSGFGPNCREGGIQPDVLPILRQNCTVCHGSTQQISGLRTDRRSSMMKAVDRRIIPGNSGSSRLFLRLTGTEFGPQMPPTGALPPDQIATIRKWIDQGANWPDALANEMELPPADSKAVALVGMLRSGDSQGFLATLKRDPKLLNARGPGGGTPLHYSALYGTPTMLETMIKMGAKVNARNDANATPLLWAATDLGKTRCSLRHGADVNARSDDMRTPLMAAARKPGNEPVVRLLLEHGANPNPNAHPATESCPLIEAATAGTVRRWNCWSATVRD